MQLFLRKRSDVHVLIWCVVCSEAEPQAREELASTLVLMSQKPSSREITYVRPLFWNTHWMFVSHGVSLWLLHLSFLFFLCFLLFLFLSLSLYCFSSLQYALCTINSRVSYRGGAWNIPPPARFPPPKILKFSMM